MCNLWGWLLRAQLIIGNFLEIGVPKLTELFGRWKKSRGSEFHVRAYYVVSIPRGAGMGDRGGLTRRCLKRRVQFQTLSMRRTIQMTTTLR